MVKFQEQTTVGQVVSLNQAQRIETAGPTLTRKKHMKLKSLKSFTSALAVTAVCVTTALADFIPLPVKWSQPIQYDALSGLIIGRDRLSDHTGPVPGVVIRADDFLCQSHDPIVAVRWWGSYIGEGPASGLAPRPKTPPGTIPFDISFHDSTANYFPGIHPFSLPTNNLSLQFAFAQEDYVGVDQSGDYVYRYDAYLQQPFLQQGTAANPLEYFIDIDQPSGQNWGWHETPLINLDFPASAPGHAGPWANDPPHDLAFELMTIPEPGVLTLSGLGFLLLLTSRRRR